MIALLAARRGASPVDGDSGPGDGTCPLPCPNGPARWTDQRDGMGSARKAGPAFRSIPSGVWMCQCAGPGPGPELERTERWSLSLARSRTTSIWGKNASERRAPFQEKGSTPLGEPTGAVRDGCEAGLSAGSFLEGDHDSCPPGSKEQLGARDCDERR